MYFLTNVPYPNSCVYVIHARLANEADWLEFREFNRDLFIIRNTIQLVYTDVLDF